MGKSLHCTEQGDHVGQSLHYTEQGDLVRQGLHYTEQGDHVGQSLHYTEQGDHVGQSLHYTEEGDHVGQSLHYTEQGDLVGQSLHYTEQGDHVGGTGFALYRARRSCGAERESGSVCCHYYQAHITNQKISERNTEALLKPAPLYRVLPNWLERGNRCSQQLVC